MNNKCFKSRIQAIRNAIFLRFFFALTAII